MSRRRREMYSGHARLSMRLCVVLSADAHTTALGDCSL